jgi:starch synthase (maltosyl-transferring)
MTARSELPVDGLTRVVIESVTPEVDGGRFPVKRTVGDELVVEADVFADGHDEIRALLRWSHGDSGEWHERTMEPLGNDRWRASFALEEMGRYRYTIDGAIDRFGTWQHDLAKRIDAGQDIAVDLVIGARLVGSAVLRAEDLSEADAAKLRQAASQLADDGRPTRDRGRLALDEGLAALVGRYPDPEGEATYDRQLEVEVDRERARFSTWYELFPRSASPDPKRHGTLRDVVARLPYVAELGFDVLYLPPIHPIGRQFRKGPNNTPASGPDDPGVPWAIGGPEGGHTAIHPELGTEEDFRALVEEGQKQGIEIALDIAFQASPDHPWASEHPEWFRARPDGTIQYAENPPKKYQDIYPFDFEGEDWPGLWQALNGVVRHWIGQGVRIFRVDNPHTKPFGFWQWLIADVKRDHPDALFLAEAFTRPKVMYRLGKVGFTQSYTYFTWRNTKQELTDYFTELTRTEVREFFRPNAWTNTPDILHEVLQLGARPAFEARLVLAATLAASYGVYGPAYELLESTPREPGSEEYLDSEKYQQRTWDLDSPHSLRELIASVNRARREHPALQSNERLRFHDIDNDQLIAYTKTSADGEDIVLAVVTLDFTQAQSGTLVLGLDELGLPQDAPFELVDLLDGSTHLWQGAQNRVEVDPAVRAGHVFHVRPRVRSEREFEHYQ